MFVYLLQIGNTLLLLLLLSSTGSSWPCMLWINSACDASSLMRAAWHCEGRPAGPSAARASPAAPTQTWFGTRWGSDVCQTKVWISPSRQALASCGFFQEHKAVSEQRRKSCQHRGLLQLCRVYDEDSGVFFCDRRVVEVGVAWTLRRAVSVTVVRKWGLFWPVFCYLSRSNLIFQLQASKFNELNELLKVLPADIKMFLFQKHLILLLCLFHALG